MRRLLLLLAGLAWAASGCGKAQNSLLLLDELPNVGSITIEGNEQFDDKTLKRLMVLSEKPWWNPIGVRKFRESQLDSDVLAILTHYMRRGYLRTRVVDLQKRLHEGAMHITIKLEEGEQIVTHEVVVIGARALDPNRVRGRLAVEPDEPLDPFRLDEDRRTILQSLADQGHWQASVLANVQFFGDSAIVFYKLDEGDPVTVGEVEITGLAKVKPSLARREIEVEEGDLLRLKDLRKSQIQLLESGYFADAQWDTTAADTLADQLSVLIHLRERKLARVEAGVGLSSQEKIRVSLGWTSRNLLSTGLRFGITNQTDFDLTDRLPTVLDRSRSDLFLNIPRIFGTRWELQPSVFYLHDRDVLFVRDEEGNTVAEGQYQQDILGQALRTRRTIGDPRSQVVVSFESRLVFNDADSVARSNDPQLFRDEYVTNVLTGRLDRDRRNDFFDPTHGGYYNVFLQAAGGALGGNNDFQKSSLGATLFRDPPGRVPVLAGRLYVGWIRASDADSVGGQPVESKVETIPVEDRFYLGGANSVRGFLQDELDGTLGTSATARGGILSLLGNVEARVPLFWLFSGVTFLDMGNVWQDEGILTWANLVPHGDPDHVSPRDVRYAYGLGLRLRTPLGPARLDYARKWNIPRGSAEGKDRWHVAIGHAF